MKLRLAVSALSVLAIAAGAPALALAQGASNTEASTPVANPPAKMATHKAHHAKAKTTHTKAATTKAAK
jgi:hypothetical protein